MVQNRSWEETLKFGQAVELYVLSVIQRTYPNAYAQDGFYKEWDIFIPEIRKGIEVKCDMTSNKTGCFVVEVSMGGVPSALTTTKAEFWVFYNGFYLYWVKPVDLMKEILIEGISISRFVGGTDSKEKAAYFVPEITLRKASMSVFTLTDVPNHIQYDPEKQK